jgi:phthalate 4,5-dioxygenase
MLSKQDNEMLTRVGRGTPMGELFRCFWLPALLPAELAAPARIRLLGEDLVGFRTDAGQPAFIAANCPHRGASLFYARTEDNGIRCVYHGWKFDVTGQCVETPNEPATVKDVRAVAYPAREWGGVVWIYMGPPERIPELPQMEWCLVRDEQRVIRRWIHETNYAQSAEGDIDTSHVSFLHRRFVDGVMGLPPSRDLAPKLMMKETDYGFVYGGRRTTEGSRYHWRLTQWMLPFFSAIPGAYPLTGHGYVPMDDEHTSVIGYRYHAERPLSADERASVEHGLQTVPRIDPTTLLPVANRRNDYLIDRQMQRTHNFTGIVGISEQDMAMTQSMGAIVDRSKEHLGTSDVAVIAMRRVLLRLAQQVQDGGAPYAAYHGEVYRVRPLDVHSEQASLEGVIHENERALVAFGQLDAT